MAERVVDQETSVPSVPESSPSRSMVMIRPEALREAILGVPLLLQSISSVPIS